MVNWDELIKKINFYLFEIILFIFNHKHVNIFFWIYHVSGSLLTHNGAQFLRIKFGVKNCGGKVFEAGALPLHVWQIIAKVAVEFGIVRQLIKNQIVYATYSVAISFVKQLDYFLNFINKIIIYNQNTDYKNEISQLRA